MSFGLLISILILSLSANVLLERAPAISMDEDFVFKVSLALLCFSLLLSIIVLFLIFWLGKIHHQVDSISKGWKVYCRLAATEETPITTENQPENQDTCSPLPLVFFNQQAADSHIVSSWKHINRAFAYASVRSDVDRPRPNTEETAFVLQIEDNKSDDDSKTQEQTVPIPDVPVASYLQIVGNNSPIVTISASERPTKDVKQDKRRIHISVSSANDDDSYKEPLEDCPQAELETMRLVDEEDFASEDIKICSKNEANAQHIGLKRNDISEATKGRDTDKSECVVSIEESREESAEFCQELHDLTNTTCDEQYNGTSSQLVETKNKANGRVMDDTKLPNENDDGYVAVFHSDESRALSEDSKKAITCAGCESERVVSTKTRPKGKRRRKKKSETGGIHSDEKNKTEGRKGVAPLGNVDEDKNGFLSTQRVEQMDKTGRNSDTDFQQIQQHSGEKVKSSVFSDNDEKNDSEYQIVNHVEQFVNNAGTTVPLTYEYHAGSISESDRKIKPGDGRQEQCDVRAANEDATERNGSSGIVSQLQDLLKRKSLDLAYSVDRENKITGEPDATESFSKDDYLTVVQENKAHEGKEHHSTATDLRDRQITAEQIYSHVDDGNDNLYCEISTAAQPEGIYVNHDDVQNVGDGCYDHKVPIYANIGLQHGTAMCNGNHALQNEYEFAIYSNDVIDV